ncbi:DUF447 domain-containing protein [Derxia gummosa]|uniref:DUF447 domain-containing protein n=1 Tax=Derxia gummosa DSM 723 TaxID=1121388 RepID=A0A8B6X947_9BURK|nr:DUF447 domain-containing protein [Derxia gummosa]
MPQIYETVITTVDADGLPHVAPMGARFEGDEVLIAPFRPSITLDNILATRVAVLNVVTDVRVFAGCVTGRKTWPTLPAEEVAGVRLEAAISHVELGLADIHGDESRPLLALRRVFEATHADFVGYNRAQAAVIEGAVLVSRLHLLPSEKIDAELAYLQIAIDRTAGPNEIEAWQWLLDAVAAFRIASGERARPADAAAATPVISASSSGAVR